MFLSSLLQVPIYQMLFLKKRERYNVCQMKYPKAPGLSAKATVCWNLSMMRFHLHQQWDWQDLLSKMGWLHVSPISFGPVHSTERYLGELESQSDRQRWRCAVSWCRAGGWRRIGSTLRWSCPKHETGAIFEMVQHPRGVFGAKRCLACFSSPDPTFVSEEILNWLKHILQQVLLNELNWYHTSSGSDKQHTESASVARVQRKNMPTIQNMFPGVRSLWNPFCAYGSQINFASIRRKIERSTSFFLAGRSMPWWAVGSLGSN